MGLYELLQMYRLYRPQLAEATAEQYRYAIRSLEKFFKRAPTTTDLSEPVILRFLAARLAEVSPRTVRRERGDIFTLWRFAWKRRLCSEDPRDVDIPPIVPRIEPPIALTVEQVDSPIVSWRTPTAWGLESGNLVGRVDTSGRKWIAERERAAAESRLANEVYRAMMEGEVV